MAFDVSKFKSKLTNYWVQLKSPQGLFSDTPGTDDHYYVRLGWLIVIVGFGGFVLWASFAPIDRGVSATGTVIMDGQRKLIQPVNAGVVDEILVKNGDNVEAGQVLIRLNNLDAEAQLNGTRESIQASKAKIAALEASVASRKLELGYLQEQISGMKTLVKEGYVAKNRLLELERSMAQTQGSLQRDEGDLESARRQLNDLMGKLPADEFDLKNTEVRSPVNGAVVNLDVFTKGQVVQAGQRLMEVVPRDQPMVIDAEVPVNLIDKVHKGLNAKVLFTAFNARTTPKVPAIVTVVPSDRSESKQGGQYYYQVKLELLPEAIETLRHVEVRAGMPVQVFIITGERTFMNYLFRPLLDRAESAFGEQ